MICVILLYISRGILTVPNINNLKCAGPGTGYYQLRTWLSNRLISLYKLCPSKFSKNPLGLFGLILQLRVTSF